VKIYTKTGDAGTTSIWGGKRLSKDDSQVEAYGTVDELAASLGTILTYKVTKQDRELLTAVQRDLHTIMSQLCDADADIVSIEGRLGRMESFVDEVEKKKPTQPKFILLQGSAASIACHIARTVCRRAERRMVAYVKKAGKLSEKKKAYMLQYLNRLSDMLFAMARKYNTEKEILV
jgi:cob(I)alamin adenosyltransferase